MSDIAETLAPVATEAAETAEKSGFNITPIVIAGVVIGLIVAVVLAYRKANKLYGKEW